MIHRTLAFNNPNMQAEDPCVTVMTSYTEEGKKVERNGGKKFLAVFRRLGSDEMAAKAHARGYWDTEQLTASGVKVSEA